MTVPSKKYFMLFLALELAFSTLCVGREVASMEFVRKSANVEQRDFGDWYNNYQPYNEKEEHNKQSEEELIETGTDSFVGEQNDGPRGGRRSLEFQNRFQENGMF